MLNAYPDSLGGNLGDIVTLLKTEAMQDVFSSFYILPSLYHSDLDRGFSVIDYDLNEQLADREDLDQLKNMGIDLKLDFILNHASAQSPQFQDLVEKGEASAYRDFFIDWNRFWEGHGTMTGKGIQPHDRRSVRSYFLQCFTIKLPHLWRLDVYIHLSKIVSAMHFLIKGIPVRHLFSIRKFHHQDRQPGFAEKHLLQAAFLRLDIAFLRHGSMPFPEGDFP